MNVALIGATGNVGSRVLAELLSRGHTVTAVARDPSSLDGKPGVIAKKGDVSDQSGLAALVAGHDAVISSLPFTPLDAVKLIEGVRASGVKRFLVVGGAGSLEVAPGLKLIDSPQFPAEYKVEAAAGSAFLDRLLAETDLDWTFLSPSALIGPGTRTGTFRLGLDQLLVTETGSNISYEDYAVALVDELENHEHSRKRFTVGY